MEISRRGAELQAHSNLNLYSGSQSDHLKESYGQNPFTKLTHHHALNQLMFSNTSSCFVLLLDYCNSQNFFKKIVFSKKYRSYLFIYIPPIEIKHNLVFRIQKSGARMEKPARCFQDLIVWQKSHQLVLDTYRYTKGFPKEELYGVTSQLRRSVVSIPANISEGFKKRGKGDKLRFLNIAQGSLEESRYFIILANDLKYGDTSELQTQMEEVSKLLEAYSKSIRNSML
jgi:four helix bundle protein